MAIIKKDRNWDILFDQIVKGNVIPVIGPELVELGDTTSLQRIIDEFAETCGIDRGEKTSFSQLVFDPKFKVWAEGADIHSLINDNIDNIIEDNIKKDNNALLRKFLSIPYFPFVITTLFDPIVESVMREIHGDRLNVMYFRNDPNKNDDLVNKADICKPTLYYMFGKADGKSDSFVVTDTDMLRFSRTWMLPNDSSNHAKPATLSNILSKHYLLVLGSNYQDWLFRFFWYAMKDDGFGVQRSTNPETKNEEITPGGMYATDNKDEQLIGFLNRVNTFGEKKYKLSEIYDEIIKGIGAVEERNRKEEKLGDTQSQVSTIVPETGTDVFISYSRGDKEIVEMLYEVLTSKGLNVWYDMHNLYMGVDFMKQIENAIRNSTFFVPVLTNTIIKQAGQEHPYRIEWLYAKDHIMQIGGIPYCYPFLEKKFNPNNLVAKVPDELKSHHACTFSMNEVREKAEELAESLINEMERRKNGKR